MNLPILDDRSFEELLSDVQKLIHLYAPQWTDYNYHDPGITFIELFTWLAEAQQYYMDQIGERNFRKFLKLLGRPLASMKFARGFIAITSPQAVADRTIIPTGTRFDVGGLHLETIEPLYMVNSKITKILTSTYMGYFDNTDNSTAGVAFYAFGPDAEPNSKLYLGFDKKLSEKKLLAIYFKVFADYPITISNYQDPCTSHLPCSESSCITWEYSIGPNQWQPLASVIDETNNFSRSGRIVFSLSASMDETSVDGSKFYWLRGLAGKTYYVLAPRIVSILLNTVPVAQRDTYVETITLYSDRSNSLSYLGLQGFISDVKEKTNKDFCKNVLIQTFIDKHGWYDCKLVCFDSDSSIFMFAIDNTNIPNKPINGMIKMKVSAVDHEINIIASTEAIGAIRLITWDPAIDINSWIKEKNSGLPNQTFALNPLDVLPDSLSIQVWDDVTGCWQDWKMVDDFDSSGPEDLHYRFDGPSGALMFGDGIYGAIPCASLKPIRIISCRACNGSQGNITISRKAVDTEAGIISRMIISTCEPLTGGSDPESVEEAIISARQEQKDITRAITTSDYEYLALSTPGVRVARAKVISGSGENQVTVIAVPFSNKKIPFAGRDFTTAVCRHLNRHRLITTEIRIVKPGFVKVDVGATVTFKEGYSASRDVIITALQAFLRPVDGQNGEKGWPFGRTVYISEIYKIIENVAGVDYVENVSIAGNIVSDHVDEISVWQNETIHLDEYGNLNIPNNSLVCSGDHYIETSNTRPVRECRRRGGDQ